MVESKANVREVITAPPCIYTTINQYMVDPRQGCGSMRSRNPNFLGHILPTLRSRSAELAGKTTSVGSGHQGTSIPSLSPFTQPFLTFRLLPVRMSLVSVMPRSIASQHSAWVQEKTTWWTKVGEMSSELSVMAQILRKIACR